MTSRAAMAALRRICSALLGSALTAGLVALVAPTDGVRRTDLAAGGRGHRRSRRTDADRSTTATVVVDGRLRRRSVVDERRCERADSPEFVEQVATAHPAPPVRPTSARSQTCRRLVPTRSGVVLVVASRPARSTIALHGRERACYADDATRAGVARLPSGAPGFDVTKTFVPGTGLASMTDLPPSATSSAGALTVLLGWPYGEPRHSGIDGLGPRPVHRARRVWSSRAARLRRLDAVESRSLVADSGRNRHRVADWTSRNVQQVVGRTRTRLRRHRCRSDPGADSLTAGVAHLDLAVAMDGNDSPRHGAHQRGSPTAVGYTLSATARGPGCSRFEVPVDAVRRQPVSAAHGGTGRWCSTAAGSGRSSPGRRAVRRRAVRLRPPWPAGRRVRDPQGWCRRTHEAPGR